MRLAFVSRNKPLTPLIMKHKYPVNEGVAGNAIYAGDVLKEIDGVLYHVHGTVSPIDFEMKLIGEDKDLKILYGALESAEKGEPIKYTRI